ncbi:MAG: hypothetical protein NVSMB16_11940 [Acidimicrobiales bacterium]
MRRRWYLPFPVVSDPGGDRFLQPLDVWNPAERGGIAWPAIILFAPDGREVFRMRSHDFADRPGDEDLLVAVQSLRLKAIDLAPADAEAEAEDDDGAFRVDAFGSYFRGIRSGTFGLAGRMVDAGDRQAVLAMTTMAQSFLDHWSQRRKAAG